MKVTESNDTGGIQTNSQLVLVTGPSGAGRSTAIKALEDLGYEAIDNLPLSLIERLFAGPPLKRPLALGIDVRNRDYSTGGLLDALAFLESIPDVMPELLYLDCRREILLRRFSETRRRHPMAPKGTPGGGIDRELDILNQIKHRADVLLDTSELSPNDLRAELERLFASEGGQGLAVSVHSFSYKRGVPRGVDMVMDCRFLDNPHWVKGLRQLTGMDDEVGDHIRNDTRFDSFYDKIRELLLLLLPGYKEEGKAHFSIGFGCTGGQHRSVFMAETIAQTLAQAGWQVSIRHRELDRRAEMAKTAPVNTT